MPTETHSLIYRVRDKLSSLPPEYCSDEQIYQDLKDSHDYIIPKLDPTIDESDSRVGNAIVALGTYLTYLNYLSLATMQFNNTPVLASEKLNSYKEIALALIRDISGVVIDNNLSMDVEYYKTLRPSAMKTAGGAWN